MSIFSSLDYLLTRAASTINQTPTDPPQNLLLLESQFLNNYSRIFSDEHLTIYSTSQTPCQHLLLGVVKSSIEAEINKSFVSSTPENWTNFISYQILQQNYTWK